MWPFKRKPKPEVKAEPIADRVVRLPLKEPPPRRLYLTTAHPPIVQPPREPYYPRQSTDDGFGMSMAVGMMTGNPLEAALLGGNPVGAIIGAEMHSEPPKVDWTPSAAPDPSPSYPPDSSPSACDSGSSSWDSGGSSSDYSSSSCDSGSSSGGDSSW